MLTPGLNRVVKIGDWIEVATGGGALVVCAVIQPPGKDNVRVTLDLEPVR